MKNILVSLLFLPLGLIAQNTFPGSGEVLINTSSSSGNALTVGGSINIQDKNLSSFSDNTLYVTEEGQTTTGVNAAEFAFFVAGPGSGSTTQGPYFFLRGNNYTRISDQKGMLGLYAGKIASPTGDDGKVVLFSHTDVDIRTGEDASSNGNKLVVKTNGNIGVGTNSPQSKLSVKGNVESQEIQVKTNVADYVFSSEYHKMSLEELEKFIEINNHLPRIQTQKEVDENRGLVKLGELSVSLMEKVEELTLHLIEINNRLKIVEEENRILKEKLN